MTITPDQIAAVVSGSAALVQDDINLHEFGLAIKKLEDNNWVTTLNIATGVGIQFTVDAPTQASIISQYTALKVKDDADRATLP